MSNPAAVVQVPPEAIGEWDRNLYYSPLVDLATPVYNQTALSNFSGLKHTAPKIPFHALFGGWGTWRNNGFDTSSRVALPPFRAPEEGDFCLKNISPELSAIGIKSLPTSVCTAPCDGAMGAKLAAEYLILEESPRLTWRGHTGGVRKYKSIPRNGSLRFDMSHWIVQNGSSRQYSRSAETPWLGHENAMPVGVVQQGQYNRNMVIMWVSYLTSFGFCVLAFRECGGLLAIRRCMRDLRHNFPQRSKSRSVQ